MAGKRNRKRNQINKDREETIRDRIARKTKRIILMILTLLSVPCFVLLLKIGETAYPSWIIENRTQIIGILILGIVVILLLSPLMVEVNSNSRPFSGSNKNPYIDPWK